jgi:hypothetical protein
MKTVLAACVATIFCMQPAFAQEEAIEANVAPQAQEDIFETEVDGIPAEELQSMIDDGFIVMTEEGAMVAPEVTDIRDSSRVVRRGNNRSNNNRNHVNRPRRGNGDHVRRGNNNRRHNDGNWNRRRVVRRPIIRYPVYPVYPIYPVYRVTCLAQNRYGTVYRATGTATVPTQRYAVRKCEARSNTYCRPMGCRRSY